ncbi:MAG: amidase [Ilumatobacteraceae bacterium]|nr:amidase [Ilumatobacteraceae bacterium]
MRHSLAQAVRTGEIDPVSLVQESLRRIAAATELNAVIDLYAEDALSEAASHSRKGALAGLPVLVKDMARVAGRRTTLGSTLFAHAAPDDVDDVVVARLKAAGAIVIGRTNSPEFGAAAFTTNSLHGSTRNPWNPAFSPGGSSGGSTAALAAGLAPLATTSDGGGSTRIPAAFCGLVGYKPTMGAIGRNVLPRWIGFSTQGNCGATVADVLLEASVTLGEAPGDFLSIPRAAIELEPRRPTKVLVCRSFRDDVDDDIEDAFERTVSVIQKSGIAVERVDAPSDKSTGFQWYTISAAELAQSLLHLEDRWGECEDYVQMSLAFGKNVTAAQYIAAQRERHALCARFDALLWGDTVMVTPICNSRSWPAEGPMASSAGKVSGDSGIATNTSDLNFTGHPAVSVPMGLDQNGVPCGIQIIAPRFRDGLALGLAQVLETEQPWPAVAPRYTPFGLS